MNPSEVRRLTTERIRYALFGDNWRADSPTEDIGGLIGALIGGGLDEATYRRTAGEVQGLLKSLQFIKESTQEAYGQDRV